MSACFVYSYYSAIPSLHGRREDKTRYFHSAHALHHLTHDRGVRAAGRAGEVLRRRGARGVRAEPRRVRGADFLRHGE